MAQVFRESVEARGITNARLIPQRWEEAPEETLGEAYDVVFAAFSLGLEDLRGALEKMHRVCRGRVFVYWFAGESSWQKTKREIWPLLHGQELPAPAGEDIMAGLIRSLGWDLSVKSLGYRRRNDYASLPELAAEQRVSYRLDSPELEERFLALIKPYVEEREGRYWVEESARFNSYSWPGGQAGRRCSGR
jgi:hypothetical protein